MTSPRERRRARRRAEKHMEGAWAAVEAGRLDHAEQSSARAVAEGGVNARLWHERGEILVLCGRADDAEQAFRMAIRLQPGYAEAFRSLGRLQEQRGKRAAAERLTRHAAELESPAALAPVVAAAQESPASWTERTGRFDWLALEAELGAHGCARLPFLLTPDECAELRVQFASLERFEFEAVLAGAQGLASARIFARPLPPLVEALREELYARAALVANRWNVLCPRGADFPLRLEAWLARCHDEGQTRTAPRLWRLPEGGFVAPRAAQPGRLCFPLALWIDLGPRGAGGDLRLVDLRPGRRLRERRVATDPGDGVLHCTRERPVVVGHRPGLQAVATGIAPVEGERFALGLPFEDER